ncbi:HAD-IA family hydrolase [Pseudomonas sp. LRF_L74]|uniref:HAD-IA family hydrolase n=1 Tax=Pseudomonas sp. LRF_L74 TaxID=3369422 RepID=UPI003F5D59B2
MAWTTEQRIEGVIFDCDGTLVDSERLAVRLLAELIGEQRVSMIPDEVMARFRGNRFADFLAGLGESYPQLDIELIDAGFRQRSLPLFREHLVEMPGAVAFVRSLELAKCVASNGPRIKIETSLATVGLLDDFRGRIVSAYEVNAWKPSPLLIEHAARVIDLPASRCLLVEDSLPGVMAGLAAGSPVAGFGEADFSTVADHPGFHRVHDYDHVQRLVERLS